MKAFIITVIGIVIGLAASLANIMWLAVLAALIALAGAYIQYRDATAFESNSRQPHGKGLVQSSTL